MPLNLARTGTAIVLGAGDGALRGAALDPAFTLGTEPIHWHTVAELGVLLAGGLVQFMAPRTMPTIVDGAVDAAGALLASNVTGRLIGGAAATTPYLQARGQGYRRGVATRVSPMAAGNWGGASPARAAVGTVDTGTRRVVV